VPKGMEGISDCNGISTVLILVHMLIELADHLQEAGAKARLVRRPAGDFDALLQVDVDGIEGTFAVEIRSRPPYPNELDVFLSMHNHLAKFGVPLLFAPSISEGLGLRLVKHGWSWADSRGYFELRAPGIRLKNRAPSKAPAIHPRRTSLPQGPGALSIVRFLIRDRNEWGGFGPTHLANIAQVSQPRASQVLASLASADLVERVPDGWRANREDLLDAFLNQYRGPGGAEVPLYSLDAPAETAARIVERAEVTQARIAVSADVGPDLISPWRSPSVVIVYMDEDTHIDELELVRAKTRADANVLLRVPDDTSVFRSHTLEADLKGRVIPLADETQMIWDLHDLGGDDRIEAAGEMRKWLLTFH
jgi:hypothetical protein